MSGTHKQETNCISCRFEEIFSFIKGPVFREGPIYLFFLSVCCPVKVSKAYQQLLCFSDLTRQLFYFDSDNCTRQKRQKDSSLDVPQLLAIFQDSRTPRYIVNFVLRSLVAFNFAEKRSGYEISRSRASELQFLQSTVEINQLLLMLVRPPTLILSMLS